jgi:ParB-like chromosome segregation protein Spo0J
MNKLTIDEDFSTLLTPLSDTEYATLEQRIIKDGRVFDRIKVWGDIIIDGEHRYKIACEHGIPFETEEMNFRDREAARRWIIENQIGRRNIDSLTRAGLIGKLREEKSIKETAKATNKSVSTVKRDAANQRVLKELPIEARNKITTGKVEASGKALRELGSLPEEKKSEVINLISNSHEKAGVKTVSDAIQAVKNRPSSPAVTSKIVRDEQEAETAVGKLMRIVDGRLAHFRDEPLGHYEKCMGFLREFDRCFKNWIREYD